MLSEQEFAELKNRVAGLARRLRQEPGAACAYEAELLEAELAETRGYEAAAAVAAAEGVELDSFTRNRLHCAAGRLEYRATMAEEFIKAYERRRQIPGKA